jgi:hypothetical protein
MVVTLWSPKGPGEFWLGSPGPSCFQTPATNGNEPAVPRRFPFAMLPRTSTQGICFDQHKMRISGPAAALSITQLGRKLHKHFSGSPGETHNELESRFMVGTLWSPKGPGEFWLGSPGPSCFHILARSCIASTPGIPAIFCRCFIEKPPPSAENRLRAVRYGTLYATGSGWPDPHRSFATAAEWHPQHRRS